MSKKSAGAAHFGHLRNKTALIPEAPGTLGLRYPLPQMYCALSPQDRGEINVSNDAGSFVCNNTAYQMSYHYPELQFGLIHVPAHHCKNLPAKTDVAVDRLTTMLKAGVKFLSTESIVGYKTPHTNNNLRLPVKKKDLEVLRSNFENQDKCLFEYFKRSRGEDERSGLWSLLD